MQTSGRSLAVSLLLAIALGFAAGWLARNSSFTDSLEARARQTVERIQEAARERHLNHRG